MSNVDRLAALIRAADSRHEMGAGALAEDILDSYWFLDVQCEAFDLGVSIAGRYGHEYTWDSDNDPYEENPYREPKAYGED
jgi:hypothetical protein